GGGGVRGQRGVGRAEQAALGGEIFDDALDDHVGLEETLAIAGPRDAPEDLVARLGAELALLDLLAERALDTRARSVGRARRGLDDDGREARCGGGFRGARPHESCPHDSHALDLAHVDPPCDAPDSPASSRTLATIVSSAASWPKTSATPISLSFFTSAGGMTPPTTTGTSTPRCRSRATTRPESVSGAPDGLDTPMALPLARLAGRASASPG